MKDYEIQYLLSKILLGYQIVEWKHLTLHIHPLNIRQNYLAQKVFVEAYEEALLSGVFTREEMLDYMIEQGVWSEEKEFKLLENVTSMENEKINIYSNFLVPQLREGHRRRLRQLEKEQTKLHKIKHANDHADCEGIATYSRWNWIIENTTTNEDGTPYDFSDVDVSFVLRLTEKDPISSEDMRAIVRSYYWQKVWVNGGKDAERILRRPSFEFSREQEDLLAWTRLYSSLDEATDKPPQNVIEDDDALDGWLIKRRKETEKQQGQDRFEEIAGKHQNADHVLVPARSQEEAQKIYDLNGPEGKMNVESRLKTVKESSEEGDNNVHHTKFEDVKRKRMLQANNLGR